MSRSKHTEAQMIAAVKQMEAGRKAEDVAREVASVRTRFMPGSRSTAAWTSARPRKPSGCGMRTGGCASWSPI
jgi:hypothetical protein